jgi:DNA-directed RNA polymerase subunit RPC12/RpoP
MNWELRCLNCSRHLADVVRGDDGRSRLRPPFGRGKAPILVVGTGRGLQCKRCGGRVMAEAVRDRSAVSQDARRATDRLPSVA